MIYFDYRLEIVILIATAFACWYVYFLKVIATYWSSRNVPHLPPKFLGNALTCGTTQPIQDYFCQLYRDHKEKRILGIWSLQTPALVVFDPQIMRTILVSDFSNFHDRLTMDVGDHDPLIKGNLFNLNGHSWRNMRVKLAPTFTSGKMKMMYSTILKCGQEFEAFIKKIAESGERLDVKDVTARFTTNIIASCAFGIECNALENPNTEFRIYGRKAFEPTVKQIALNVLAEVIPFLGKLFKISQLPSGTTEFFISAVKDTMDFRKRNNVKRNDFLQLLIELTEKGKIEDVDKDDREEDTEATVGALTEAHDTKFTLNEASAQAFVFFAAGFETSSMTMSLALYELAKHQDIQSTLRSEIKAAIEKDGGAINYETLIRLNYLDCVIQETLRKYPVVPVLFREAVNDYYLAEIGVTIPKKTVLFIPNMALTNDPELFPEPQTFDPMRFSDERKSQMPPHCHIPFGDGPRSCIGNRFGLLQTKVGLVSFLAHHSVHPSDNTPQVLTFGPRSLSLQFKDTFHLKIQSEQNTE